MNSQTKTNCVTGLENRVEMNHRGETFNKKEVYHSLLPLVSAQGVMLDADMRAYTSFKAGGKADILVIPANEEQLAAVLRVLDERTCPRFLMGNGTNFLVRDGGFRGVIVRIGEAFARITAEREQNLVTAQSGALLSQIAKAAAEAALTGFEFACGIPGSLGGAVAMNAGAYDGEMKDVLLRVKAMDYQGNVHTLQAAELNLGYRKSIFQENGWVILEAQLQLRQGEEKKIKERMKELNQRRNEKQPVNYASAGSFFKRPPGQFAGKLIQDAKLKGLAYGDAQVSPLHAGFIVNKGHASATDIINLMKIVQNTVWDQFGVKLEPEVRMIGEEKEGDRDVNEA